METGFSWLIPFTILTAFELKTARHPHVADTWHSLQFVRFGSGDFPTPADLFSEDLSAGARGAGGGGTGVRPVAKSIGSNHRLETARRLVTGRERFDNPRQRRLRD